MGASESSEEIIYDETTYHGWMSKNFDLTITLVTTALSGVVGSLCTWGFIEILILIASPEAGDF